MASKTTGFVLAALMAGASAQAGPADHYTVAELTKAMEALKAKAAASGSASDTLASYPGHHTMLAYRSKDGSGEVHKQYADIFYVVRGQAKLITEGMLTGAKEESPGELRGPAVDGGKTMLLGPGDVVHIPAGTPHQLLIGKGDELLYFVVKVREN